MFNSRLIKILQAFTPGELKEFRKFIETPFFNKEGSYLLRFFDEVKKYYPGFTDAELEKGNLFKKLYKGKEFSDATMRKLSSGIIKLAEQFLRYKAFTENTDAAELLYIQKLREKRIEKLFESESAALEKKLAVLENSVDLDYFRNRYKLELEKINFYLDFNHMIKKQQESLQAVQGYLVYDSLLNLLDIGFNILVGSTTMYKGEENTVLELLQRTDLEGFGRILEKNTPGLFPVYELFYRRYLSFLNIEEDESYYRYKEAALRSLSYFTWENQFTIFVSLQNICTRKFVEGKRYFSAELHEVHKEMLGRGLYVQKKGDYMNLHTYRNIVLTAFNLVKPEWISDFMEQYIDRILPEQRESLGAWTRAQIHYCRKEYGDAIKELQSVKNDHFLSKHEIKTMTMKMFYELKDFEPAISFADSYRHMITNDKTFAVLHRNSYTNFCLFYTRLIRIVTSNFESPKRSEELHFLKSEITRAATNSKEWLLAKIEELNG